MRLTIRLTPSWWASAGGVRRASASRAVESAWPSAKIETNPGLVAVIDPDPEQSVLALLEQIRAVRRAVEHVPANENGVDLLAYLRSLPRPPSEPADEDGEGYVREVRQT